MDDDAKLVTYEHYVEMLIDASFRDAAEIEAGLLAWSEKHAPIWREQGYDEQWVRQRIEMAQASRGLHRRLKPQGLTMLEIREHTCSRGGYVLLHSPLAGKTGMNTEEKQNGAGWK